MNITYILEFIKTQFDGISDPDSAESGETLLMISEYLLEQIENEPAVFTESADDRALRRSFLYCSKISRILSGFAKQYSTPITQKAQKALSVIDENANTLQEIRQECENCETRAKTIMEQQHELESSNNDLFTAQSSLEARQKEYDTLSLKLESLRKIQTEITDEKLTVLRSEIETLEPQVKKRQAEFDELTKHCKTLSGKSDELIKLITTAQNDEKKLAEEIQHKTGELDALQKTISAQRQEITDLTSAVQKANDEYNELAELIKANNRIADAIKANGYVINDRSDSNSFFRRVDELNQQARDLEAEYDRLLKNILDETEALLQAVSKRQEPNYTGGGEN